MQSQLPVDALNLPGERQGVVGVGVGVGAVLLLLVLAVVVVLLEELGWVMFAEGLVSGVLVVYCEEDQLVVVLVVILEGVLVVVLMVATSLEVLVD